MTHTEFRDKKNKNNIDMVTQIETLFIYMFDEECFTCNSFLYDDSAVSVPSVAV